jgi:ABC-type Zn uptake system ZnuABC Zn-binding protein ZnuA
MRTRVEGTRVRAWIAAAAVSVALAAGAGDARPLRVVATVPDLGSLARAVGGDRVDVFVFTKGPQDAHFVEPRPSFVRKLHDADLYLQQGMDLEIGWAPVLLRQARNTRVLPGGSGYLDASSAIPPLEVPAAQVDRSMGDVHPYGNPHYLTDPLNGLRVAQLLRDKLIELRPEETSAFRSRYQAFADATLKALVGEELVERRGSAELTDHIEDGTLLDLLGEEGGPERLGGWLGAMRERGETKAVQDHRLWPYFAQRFDLDLMATLEPLPGIAPTTRHLSQVIELMRREGVGLVLSSPYFDPRHARWVAERTGARIAEMAHQVGARKGTDDYLATIDYNLRQVLGAP